MRRRLGLLGCAILAYAPLARAGGFETPDNGTEALGRGGAFTAKASDATAFEYNVAGFAGQRGTRVLFDGKISINEYSFARAGVYPGAPSTGQPWQDQFFGPVSNQGGPFFAPFLGLSTDFGYFDRLTFAIGAYGPSGVGNPTYPLGVPAPNGQPGGWPSPARYDIVQATSTIILPTLAAAYRLTDWLDVGVALHYVIGNFNLTNVSYADISTATCPSAEFQPCDAVNNLVTTGTSWSGSGGAMIRPEPWLNVGFNVRAPIHIDSSGTVTGTAPEVAPTQGGQGPATFETELPWKLRAGARIIAKDGEFEQGDVEIDTVYETWSQSQGTGSTVNVPQLGILQNITTTVLHKYQDTVSLRLGGAYNIPIGEGSILTFRAGTYYESPATQPADTRLDFNTLAKYAGTIGAGITWRGIGFNVAYAGIYSPERVVTNGEIAPSNPSQHGAPIDPNGAPLPAVNNGTYDGFIHMIAFGVRVEMETLFGTKRSKKWTPQGELPDSAYEEAPAAAPPAKEETKPVEAVPPPPPPSEPRAAAPVSTARKPPASAAKKPAAAPAPAPPPPPPATETPKKKPTKQEEDQHEKKLEDPFAN